MGIEIRTTNREGQHTLNPEVMEILVEFAEHREWCEQCNAHTTKTHSQGSYCPLGNDIIEKLFQHPDVKYFKD